MLPDVHAPAEYLKQPGLFAATEIVRSEPPMIVPGGPKGDEAPKSKMKPVSLDELCHSTVVPVRTQTSAFPLALGIFGIVEAELPPLRFTSITQGAESDPQVLLAVHIAAGFGSEQTCL
jgi:hypothetical protein